MRAEQIPLKQKFSKGFAKTLGNNTVPVQYAYFMRNLRIRDLGITPRGGVSQIYEGTLKGTCYSMRGDTATSRLFRHFEDKREEIDYVTGTITDRSSSLTLPKAVTRPFQYANYIIICTGTTAPYIFDTTTNTLTLSTEVDTGVYPSFGASYNGFTFLAFKNKVYTSKPVTAALPGNAIKWKSSETDARQLIYDVNVTGLRGNLERLWIFTDKNIEYIDANTISTIGATTNIFSNKFAQDMQILSHDAVVPVGSKLFFITKGLKIKAIGYTQGVAQLQISDISDVPAVGIDGFMQEDLAKNQIGIKGIFDDSRNLVKRYVKSTNSLVNDLVVIYDIINTGFLCDDNKWFSNIVSMGNRLFASSAFSDNKVYEEEVGGTDYGNKITCTYSSHYLKLGQSNLLKFFRGAEFGGKINFHTNIEVSSNADGRIIMKPLQVLQGSGGAIEALGIAGAPLAGEAIAGTLNPTIETLTDRGKVIGSSHIRVKAKGNSWTLTFSGKNMKFIIDYMALFVLPQRKYRLSDMF